MSAKKIMFWSKRSFLISVGLFLCTFSLLMTQEFDSSAYTILVIVSRLMLILVSISFITLSACSLLILNSKNTSHYRNNQIKKISKYSKILFLFSIIILTAIRNLLLFVFSMFDSDEEINLSDGNKYYEANLYERSNPMSEHYDQASHFSPEWEIYPEFYPGDD